MTTTTRTEARAWPDYLRWMRRPSILGGIGSLMDVAGVVRYDISRFDPRADIVLLQRDGRVLVGEMKMSRKKALKEGVPQQERLFDPTKS